ncbi:MAG: DUF4139 domain-containing protein [Pelobium sp.]
MKNLFKISILFLLPASLLAQEKNIKSSSTIKSVTVFLTGAQIQREANNVNIPSGVSEVVFSGLSNDINQQSIQVKGAGDFTILSVNKQANFLKEQSNSEEIKKLTDDVSTQRNVISKLNDELQILKTEEDILSKNQSTYSDVNGMDINKLKALLDFQKTKIREIKDNQYRINEKLVIEAKNLNDLNRQLQTFSTNALQNTTDIVVKIKSINALKATFNISYLVNNASWYPTYDIRAKDINDPIQLIYKANVSQRSGEDWSKVKLNLSSGNPSENSAIPNLDPYVLGFNDVLKKLQGRASGMVLQDQNSLNEAVVVGYGTDKSENNIKIRGASSIAPQVVSQQNQTSLLFDIKEIYSVPSDGKLIVVEIGDFKVPATYTYTAIPKLSKNVNLTAKITDFNDMNLLSGEANIFFDGTFLGSSVIDIQQTKDTLDIALGNDKNVIVTREKQTDFKEKQFLGSSQKVTRDFVITIKNRKNKAIDLVLYDQLPISNNQDISIEKLDLSGMELNEKDGKLTWKLKLQRNEEKKLNLKYQVKYPKNTQINLE